MMTAFAIVLVANSWRWGNSLLYIRKRLTPPSHRLPREQFARRYIDHVLGTLVATSSILTVTTSNATRFNVTLLSTTTAYVLYNLNSPASQLTGTYSGSMTYTATANP